MRKILVLAAAIGVLAAACGSSNTPTQPSSGASASSCAKSSLHLLHPGQLTIGMVFPQAGKWRLFLQGQIGDKIVTAPFSLDVRS